MPRLTVNVLLGFSLALVVAVQAWAGAGGSLGVGIRIDYHTPPTASDGVFDASNFKVPGTLSATASAAGQTFTFDIVTQPAHGRVTLLDAATGSFEFEPDASFAKGVDSFTFKAVDNHGLESNIATETLVFRVSTRAMPGRVTTPPNTAVSDYLIADTAYPGETLNFTVLDGPDVGAFVLLDSHTGAFSYTPPLAFTGGVNVQFRVTDVFGQVSNVGVEHIVMLAEPPLATGGSISLQRNHKYSGSLAASTVFAGQHVTFRLVKQALHGKVVITDLATGQFTYSPKRGYLGKDSFQFRAVDQNGTPSSTAIETITVHR